MTKRPDHIRCAVLEAIERKVKPATLAGAERDLYAILSGKVTAKTSASVIRAHEIFSREFKRETLEALLLAGAGASEVEDVLRVPEDVTEVYRKLFFDTSVFEDELDIIDYAKSIPPDTFGGELKQFGVDLGKECLKVRLACGKYTVEPGIVLAGVRSTAYMMTQLAKINRADSSMANAALRWAQVSLRAVPEEEKAEQAGIEKLQLALETRDETTDAEKSGIPKDEILH